MAKIAGAMRPKTSEIGAAQIVPDVSDPIYAALGRRIIQMERVYRQGHDLSKEEYEALTTREIKAQEELFCTEATTIAGVAAFATFLSEVEDGAE